jgi:hypothetical protein
MRKVIDGVVYDEEKAIRVAYFESTYYRKKHRRLS